MAWKKRRFLFGLCGIAVVVLGVWRCGRHFVPAGVKSQALQAFLFYSGKGPVLSSPAGNTLQVYFNDGGAMHHDYHFRGRTAFKRAHIGQS